MDAGDCDGGNDGGTGAIGRYSIAHLPIRTTCWLTISVGPIAHIGISAADLLKQGIASTVWILISATWTLSTCET